MDADLIERLDCELLTLEHLRREYSLRFEKIDDWRNIKLKRSKHGDSDYYYYIKRPGDASYDYIGNSSHEDVIRVCEARLLEEAIKRIDHDIELIKALDSGFLPFDLDHINESLPKAYHCGSLPVPDRYKEASAGWISRSLEFQNRFPENYPQFKKHRTSDGVMVKTVSEVLIYERFKAAGLTAIYELPFVPNDHGPALYPDFSVLSPIDMRSVILVEFFGRMDLQKYREEFAKKVGRYIDSGYIPGVNLFFIFSDKDGNIDSLQITKVIIDILGLRNLQTPLNLHS